MDLQEVDINIDEDGVEIAAAEEIEAESESEDDNEEFKDAIEQVEAGDGENKNSNGNVGQKQKRSILPKSKEYDTSLPGAHSYLGTDLEDVPGRTVHGDDEWLSLPILFLPSVVLMPGQTLPLHLFQPASVAMMKNIVRKEKTFGLLTARYIGPDAPDDDFKIIGTTVEIFSFKEEEEPLSGIATVRVKGMGRQRFLVKDTRRQMDGVVIATVRILPERILPDVLQGAKLPNHSSKDVKTTALLTRWPSWVYNIYNADLLKHRIQSHLQSWNETLRPSMMPDDISDFSFWVAANLPFDDLTKLKLLAMDSAVMRLHAMLALMLRCTMLCCNNCGKNIADKKEVFSMSLEGPLGAYVNPGGFVHETLTLHKAKNLKLRGSPSTQNSWFPGYAWTIVECDECGQHMGWRFTAVKKIKPSKFWGLCRSSLKPGIDKSHETEEETRLPFL